MKAAIVTQFGALPRYGDFADPEAGSGESLVMVKAAALSQLTKIVAAGTHYTSTGQTPFVPGVDGVGSLKDGRRVYFLARTPPFGAMAERTVIPASLCAPVPDDLDDASAAALANPAMSSWAALYDRAQFQPGETVLVNGATGTSGRLAVQIARYLGAKKIIATGRNGAALAELRDLGADVTVSLKQDRESLIDSLQAHFDESGVDIVLDYLWGESAEGIFAAIAAVRMDSKPIRFVQIGAIGGASVSLPAAVLRSTGLKVMGSGFGSVPLERLLAGIAEIFEVAVKAGFRVAKRTVPLSQVEQTWETNPAERIVFMP